MSLKAMREPQRREGIVIEAKASEQVTIEQIGGSLTMAGFMWTQAVSERARLSDEIATLTQQLAEARALLRKACGGWNCDSDWATRVTAALEEKP